MNRHYAHVAERAGHRCEYCHAPEAIFNLAFEVEHIGAFRHPPSPTFLCGVDSYTGQDYSHRKE